MPRDPRLYLDDILEATAKIQDYTTGFDYPRFTADGRTQDAEVRNLEIIGEAAGRRAVPRTILKKSLQQTRPLFHGHDLKPLERGYSE